MRRMDLDAIEASFFGATRRRRKVGNNLVDFLLGHSMRLHRLPSCCGVGHCTWSGRCQGFTAQSRNGLTTSMVDLCYHLATIAVDDLNQPF